MKKTLLTIAIAVVQMFCAYAQTEVELKNQPNYTLPELKETNLNDLIIPKEWSDRIKISGYMQLRNNDFYQTNVDLTCPQCDRTYGGETGFSLRRMRFKVTGRIHQRVYFYLQADFASDGKNLGQLRDAYADIYLTNDETWRIRAGQSKIPYGFENLQSSQYRLGLDRNDPLNSAVKDERDMGAFLYWTSKKNRQVFPALKKMGLKGSGDYGNFGFGVYNGQRANYYSGNGNYHVVGRFTWPFQLNNGQFIETSIQGYTGYYTIQSATDGVLVKGTNREAYGEQFIDQRAAASLIIYPQPFGFQSEFNVGRGPEYDPKTNTISEQDLFGGYAQIMYQFRSKTKKEWWLMPFCRAQYYDGGKKFELDARSYTVKELELGIEWSPIKALEINTTYTFSNRRYEDGTTPQNHQEGQLLRFQLQINY